jgi:hypothetical protein
VVDPPPSGHLGSEVEAIHWHPWAWLALRDPGFRAVERTVRAAVLVPMVFAMATYGVGNDQTALFAAFGSVALLCFADFGGPLGHCTRSFAGLWIVG